MKQTLIIRSRLPGLNELIEARSHWGRFANKTGKRWNSYSQMKQSFEVIVLWDALACGFNHISSPYVVSGTWVEASRRRDPSNVVAGGLKIVLDALVAGGLLDGDGWRDTQRLGPWKFRVGNQGAVLCFEEVEDE